MRFISIRSTSFEHLFTVDYDEKHDRYYVVRSGGELNCTLESYSIQKRTRNQRLETPGCAVLTSYGSSQKGFDRPVELNPNDGLFYFVDLKGQFGSINPLTGTTSSHTPFFLFSSFFLLGSHTTFRSDEDVVQHHDWLRRLPLRFCLVLRSRRQCLLVSS